jgi:hypothetical protein
MRVDVLVILSINLTVINKIKVNIIKVIANKSENLIAVLNHDPILSIIPGYINDRKLKPTPTKMLDKKTHGIINLIIICLVIFSS